MNRLVSKTNSQILLRGVSRNLTRGGGVSENFTGKHSYHFQVPKAYVHDLGLMEYFKTFTFCGVANNLLFRDLGTIISWESVTTLT